ncbi:MAG: hypothetical protein HUJ29_01530 [Gammaproteobacteria bacterium]|nr:hypothetical protein [Gammaproteobacteria bacterium]
MMQSQNTLHTEVGTATLLDDQIIEVTIHSGIELNKEMMLNGFRQLSELAGGRYALLVDRTTSDYSMSFEAMQLNASDPNLLAQALLIPAYNSHKQMLAELSINLSQRHDIPFEVFSDRRLALDWLGAHRDTASRDG